MQAQLDSAAATLRVEYLVDCSTSCLSFRLPCGVRLLLLAQLLHQGPRVTRRNGDASGGIRLLPPACVCDFAPARGMCGDRCGAPENAGTERSPRPHYIFPWSASLEAHRCVS